MEQSEGIGDARQALAGDPHRPRYHFLPPANWLNDPNGLIQWKGQYHLFYQYNPNGAFHGTIHWGHAVSPDLVHWADLPIALAPTPGGPDQDGCFSGCAVDHDGVPTLVYTGIRPEVQCLATSADDLRTWRKHPANPIIGAPPAGFDVLGFRDPWVWREADGWYGIVGSGIRDVGGTAFLYRSPDLVHWTYLNLLSVDDQNETGTMWECPSLFPLGNKHVLLLSPIPLRKSLYLVGTYADHSFTPDTRGVLDDGGHLYAPQTLCDAAGRRLMWGWLWEGRAPEAAREAGWAGVMSLPRVLDLGPDSTLTMRPAPELAALRGRHDGVRDLALAPDGTNPLADVRGDSLELRIDVDAGDAAAIELVLRRSPDGAEQTRVVYDRALGQLTIDRRASLNPTADRDVRGSPLRLSPGERLTLRVFLDRSVLEVFANDRVGLASRIYPARADSPGLGLFVRGGRAHLHALDVWELAAIWPG